MYTSDKVADLIKETAKEKNIMIGNLLKDCELSKNTFSTMKSRGYMPRLETMIKIADSLDCSIDYLLGRTDNPNAHKICNSVNVGEVAENSGAIGVGNIVTNNVSDQDEQTIEMLNTYKKLSPLNKAKLLVYANGLTKEK